MHKRKGLYMVYALVFFTIGSLESCEEEGYCFKCKDEFTTENFCYDDYKKDYTKAEFKEMVFNLEDFGFKCKRN